MDLQTNGQQQSGVREGQSQSIHGDSLGRGGGRGAYGDDVAVAHGEGVAPAEDRAHRLEELADVPVHVLPFFPPLSPPFLGVFLWSFDPCSGEL